MTRSERIKTQEELEVKFETDRPFNDESVAQSLGRLAWLNSRLSAEFILTLFDLGIVESKIPAIMEAFAECQEDFCDFVGIGLGATEETGAEVHPLEETFDEVVEELMDTIDISHNVDLLDSHLLQGGNVQMYDYGGMSEEDILHKLTGHIKRLESKDSE